MAPPYAAPSSGGDPGDPVHGDFRGGGGAGQERVVVDEELQLRRICRALRPHRNDVVPEDVQVDLVVDRCRIGVVQVACGRVAGLDALRGARAAADTYRVQPSGVEDDPAVDRRWRAPAGERVRDVLDLPELTTAAFWPTASRSRRPAARSSPRGAGRSQQTSPAEAECTRLFPRAPPPPPARRPPRATCPCRTAGAVAKVGEPVRRAARATGTPGGQPRRCSAPIWDSCCSSLQKPDGRGCGEGSRPDIR